MLACLLSSLCRLCLGNDTIQWLLAERRKDVFLVIVVLFVEKVCGTGLPVASDLWSARCGGKKPGRSHFDSRQVDGDRLLIVKIRVHPGPERELELERALIDNENVVALQWLAGAAIKGGVFDPRRWRRDKTIHLERDVLCEPNVSVNLGLNQSFLDGLRQTGEKVGW